MIKPIVQQAQQTSQELRNSQEAEIFRKLYDIMNGGSPLKAEFAFDAHDFKNIQDIHKFNAFVVDLAVSDDNPLLEEAIREIIPDVDAYCYGQPEQSTQKINEIMLKNFDVLSYIRDLEQINNDLSGLSNYSEYMQDRIIGALNDRWLEAGAIRNAGNPTLTIEDLTEGFINLALQEAYELAGIKEKLFGLEISQYRVYVEWDYMNEHASITHATLEDLKMGNCYETSGHGTEGFQIDVCDSLEEAIESARYWAPAIEYGDMSVVEKNEIARITNDLIHDTEYCEKYHSRQIAEKEWTVNDIKFIKETAFEYNEAMDRYGELIQVFEELDGLEVASRMEEAEKECRGDISKIEGLIQAEDKRNLDFVVYCIRTGKDMQEMIKHYPETEMYLGQIAESDNPDISDVSKKADVILTELQKAETFVETHDRNSGLESGLGH